MPGPAPRYQPAFPAEFVDQARQLARHRTVSYQLHQRARLVLLLHADPLRSTVQAAAEVQLHPNAVRTWRRRWARGQFVLEDAPGRGRKGRPAFPPLDHALVKAVACEAVHTTGLPLSRLSTTDLAAQASRALGQPISPSTVWRILDADALKPWRYQSWLFPRDPRFAEKAGRVLDLYAGVWQGEALGPGDHIISADEKTSIQARVRCHPSLPPAPGRAARIEHEYDCGGALQYLAAWDVQQGIVMGRCEPATGIAPFGRLVADVMQRDPYRRAARVFWIVDNGSSHRGQAAIQRLTATYGNLLVVHTPLHASWLNQVEIYFSIIQRKVLTPNDFADLAEVEERLRLYEALANQQPHPFAWRFTRANLEALLQRLAVHEALTRPAAA